MYVRLAFAVAAHLEPEILIVDDVLAVGDAQFQKKCLGKMEEAVTSQGRTVLFVSHNLGAIKFLTRTSLYLNRGRLEKMGPTEEVVNAYIMESLNTDTGGIIDLSSPACRRGTVKKPELNITFNTLQMKDVHGRNANVFFERDPITWELDMISKINARAVEIIVVILNFDGAVLFSGFYGPSDEFSEPGLYKVSCSFSPNLLRSGNYRVRLYLRAGHWQDVIAEAATFKMEPNPQDAQELSYASSHPGLLGMIRAEIKWGNVKKL